MKKFQLLESTFKTLRIQFNIQIADQVIKGKKRVAMQLLYQLQMQLQKVNDPHDVMMHAKTGKYNVIQPLMVIKQPKEQFDKMEQDFFMQNLNERNKAEKSVNLEKHLGKFTTFAIQQAEKERRLKIKEETEERNLKEEMRKIQLNKLQRNMAFIEDWNQKGIENWKKNYNKNDDLLKYNRQDIKIKQMMISLNQQFQKYQKRDWCRLSSFQRMKWKNRQNNLRKDKEKNQLVQV